ncbi:putative transcriptional regulator NRG1 [Halenospora varia]|nr:putative transcriptional regulator NRG1 [Halenospora varia]
MPTGPSMHARNSSGKQVSLLNDEPSKSKHASSTSLYSFQNAPEMSRDLSNHSSPSIASPPTPTLMRADSYDSQNTSDAFSPITPHSLHDFGRQSSLMSMGTHKDQAHYDYRERMPSYDEYPSSQYPNPMSLPIRPPYAESRTSSFSQPQVYDEESYHNISERGGPKRYHCRYRETIGCDKTFTTSGHASRHSKIHTAEKAVPCTYKGCQKKFTRNDNMKQHLETHYKDRSRSSTSKSGSKTSALTVSAGIKKRATPGPENRNASRPEVSPIMVPAFSRSDRDSIVQPASINSISPYSPDGFQQTSPMAPIGSSISNANRGLDVLAMAVDWQTHRGEHSD